MFLGPMWKYQNIGLEYFKDPTYELSNFPKYIYQ